MAERVWKLENEGAGGGPRKFAIAGYEQTGHREMKAEKALEGLENEDLKAILRVLHDHFHSED